MTIRPYRPKADIKPFLQPSMDIETASTHEVLDIGFAWTDINEQTHYEVFQTFEQWFDYYKGIRKAADKDTRKRLTRIYAHNGVGFDYHQLILWALDSGRLDSMKFIQSGGIGIGVDIKIDRITVRLRDSLRLMPGKLGDLAKAFGVTQKGDVPDKYKSKMEEYKRRFPREYYAYLRSDVFALQEMVYRFWCLIYDKIGSIETLPMTLPALAMRLWRMTLTDEIFTPRNTKLKALERRAYTGGRTECFAVGSYDNVKVYDANSLYPSQMVANDFPISDRGGFITEYNSQHGLYEISYQQTNKTVKPVLRDEESNAFTYAGRGVYYKPEIDLLLEVGGEIEVITGYVFYDVGPLFKDFVTGWYSTRLQAQHDKNEALSYVCKILMNSLYGKLGQREIGYSIQFWNADKFIEEQAKGTVFKDMGDFVLVEEEIKSETTFVSIAGYVTAYGRAADYRKIYEAETLGYMVAYTDTDSVHIIGGELQTGENLGEWKLEKTGTGKYLAKKLYGLSYYDPKTDSYKWTMKAKGIGKSARDKMDSALIDRLIQTGGDYVTTFETFPSNNEVLTRKREPNQIFTRKRTIRRDKSLPFSQK